MGRPQIPREVYERLKDYRGRRAPGMQRRLRTAAARGDLLGPVLGRRRFKTLIGRCITGRWRGVDAVEGRLAVGGGNVTK
eukprot:6949751-Pyramimonas_sp.AAC.1